MPRTMMLDMQDLTRPARTAGLLALLCALAAVPRLSAQDPVAFSRPEPTLSYTQGSEVKIVGYIIRRNGDSVLVRDETTDAVSLLMLTDNTKISKPSGGLFDLGRERQNADQLIPGLRVRVRGTGGMNGEAEANSIEFHTSAERVAEGVAAGTVDLKTFTDSAIAATHDTLAAMTGRARDSLNAIVDRARETVRALNRRISDVNKYDMVQSRTVFFATGRAEITPEGARVLDDMITASKDQHCGCVFEIKGFTDSQGGAIMNDVLSYRRAESVIMYLTQRDVPLNAIATPLGYGEMKPIATNESSSGRAMNRRAEVRLLVSRVSLTE
jgi:outer membrane protein OmpA-like peptidoglycan-associated protein